MSPDWDQHNSLGVHSLKKKKKKYKLLVETDPLIFEVFHIEIILRASIKQNLEILHHQTT